MTEVRSGRERSLIARMEKTNGAGLFIVREIDASKEVEMFYSLVLT